MRYSALFALLAMAAAPELPEAGPLTLQQAVEIAQTRSPAAALARDRFRSAYWQRRSQRATFLPTLSLRGTAPDFTRSISKLTLPDGTEAFIPQRLVSSSLQLSIGKTIQTTGGEIFIESQLQRLDILDGRSTSYLSRPIGIGLRQSLFTFNPYKWQERIEPLRYEEARRAYVEELQSIAILAAQAYFDLLSAQDQLATARANAASTETLLTVTRARTGRRTASTEAMLETELASLNAGLELQRAELDVHGRSYALRSALALRSDEELSPEVEFEVPEITVNPEQAIAEARANRASPIGYERRRLEARRDIAQARASGRWNLDLYASYGLSQTADDLGSAYRGGQDQEQVSLGIVVPILDWGRARARRKMAESNEAVTTLSVDQEIADFDQDVTIKVLQFKVQRDRIQLAAKADEVAQQRFEAAKNRYIAGRGDVASVNQALQAKDEARRRRIEALRGFWIAYYELRRATLYDFWANRPIQTIDLDW